jgi:hypothetical protein
VKLTDQGVSLETGDKLVLIVRPLQGAPVLRDAILKVEGGAVSIQCKNKNKTLFTRLVNGEPEANIWPRPTR